MANNISRKTIELLVRKIESLENQSFTQKLVIDELENKLQQMETNLKQVLDNQSYWAPSVVPTQPQYVPAVHQTPWNAHVCAPGPLDANGDCYCAVCGAYCGKGTFIITSTSNCISGSTNSTLNSNSSDITEELEIHWDI